LKGTIVSVQTMKAYSGNRYMALLTLDLGTRRRLVVSFTPRPLYPRNRTHVPIE